MTSFYAKDGQFWLDDRPQFIHAGEFHYYRTPKDQWPQRLGLLKGAGFNTVATYIPWLWHQLAEGVTDLDGHSHPMRDLAGFLDLAAEMGLMLIPRPGPYIMAETINEGIPPWVFANYPQTPLIDQNGVTQNIASYLHPDFLACVSQWYRAVFSVLTPRQVTRGGKIIMIQLDNEMGMPHWVRNMFDLNADTIDRFARHIATGERARDYPANDLAAFLAEGLRNPATPHHAQIVADYFRFYRDYLHDYADFLWRDARANGMEVPPIVNIHGFMNGGKTFPIGLSQLIKVIEMDQMISATDVYPLYIGAGTYHQLLFVNETTKALQNRQQALFSVEFQSGGCNDYSNNQTSMYDLHSRLCISSGMRAINHYSFFAGENDPILSPVRRHDWGPPVRIDGTLRKHYYRYPRLSQVLHAYGEALIMAQPQTVTTLGFVLDNFMTEVNSAATQPVTRIITHQREVILCDFFARGLALTHRPFNALELARATLDVAQTPTLWAMMTQQCPAAIQQKLIDYVRAGGRLVLAGQMCDEEIDGTPCTLLKDALGIGAIRRDAPFVHTKIDVFHQPEVPVSFVESYDGAFDEVFARREDGAVVGFVRSLGSGTLVWLGAALTAEVPEDIEIVEQMAQRIDCEPLFRLSDWADVRLSSGARGDFLFINNYFDDPLTTTIACDDRPLLGGNAIDLPARRGLILPLDWQITPDVTLHYATGEVIDVRVDDATITLRLEPADFVAELTTSGWRCAGATPVQDAENPNRVRLHGTTPGGQRAGEIVLIKRL